MRPTAFTARAARGRRCALIRLAFCALFIPCLWGCAPKKNGPVVIYLDGAGWYSSAGSVKSGLRAAGYRGEFDSFTWSAFLGPAHDHFVNARSSVIAKRLARRIEKHRRENPNGSITVMGLSAGTSLILMALPLLPEGVQVDNVVLFSASVSSERNLTKAMAHVKRNLYATCSSHDGILAGLAVNADGRSGRPAGRAGFKLPRSSKQATLMAYSRVINLPWQPSYLAYGWNGGHTSATTSSFVKAVVAPRILSNQPYPLDRSILERAGVTPQGDGS